MLKENGLAAVLYLADYGTFWAFFAQSLNHYIQCGLFRSSLIPYRLSVLLRPLLWLLAAVINLAGLILDRLNRDERFSLGYVVVARKEHSIAENR